MYGYARGGVAMLPGTPSFAPATERTIGNNLPPWTGSPGNTRQVPGPHPRTQYLGGNLGNYDGNSGTDPAVAHIQPDRPSPTVGAWSEGDPGSTPGPSGGPLGYGEGASRLTDPGASGNAGRLNLPNREQLTAWGRPSFRRYGIQGFNDQLQVRDRHAYWDRGYQRTGITASVPGNPPNNHSDGPARADLRTVNISVNPQIGSDASRNQDDLSRPYTWLGQQDGTVAPVYGGVPGLWMAYGNRGLPQGIHDPSNGEGGPAMVRSGPPHGLHSDTIPSGKQIADRYQVTPQMRPVRIDRPSNSTAAGQSYSQTVQFQGQTGTQQAHSSQGISFAISGRGWGGA